MRGWLRWATLPVLAWVAGCAYDGTASVSQERVIMDADVEAVMDASADILSREFGRLKLRTARNIETMPVEFTTARESGSMRDLYRASSTMRRYAQLSVGQRAGAPLVRIRVIVERRDTEARGAVPAASYRLSDTPGATTPIDVDAATTPAQNAVWTYVRRDRTFERALLEELQERFARLKVNAEPDRSDASEPPSAAPEQE